MIISDSELMLHKLCDEIQCNQCGKWFPLEEKIVLDVVVCNDCFGKIIEYYEHEFWDEEIIEI